MSTDLYLEDEAHGDMWSLLLGDSCIRLAELDTDSVDLSVCSPPFDSLYTYSPSARDLGNSASRGEFLDHYGYVIAEQLRVTKPGRVACVHVQQVATKKAVDGYSGLTDFRGDVIRAFQRAGWLFHGEVTVWKDPQAQSIRTKAHALAFQTKNRDSAGTRPALADYLLKFVKPGDNAVPIPHHATRGEVTNDDWIEWASPIWFDRTDGGDVGGEQLAPVWLDIKETRTLNVRAGREHADERHICPLQLDFIERCIRLWSNPGETVLTPFAGIGSEVFVARKLGRRGIGVELKPSYWRTAVDNLRRLDTELDTPALLDLDGVTAAAS
ncbi:site-specific DNA-methyltransferase [Pseudonocardia sp. KRD-184]|uniref:Site-specific DNA-methyltransferase n=1 Tax=Pseudonocardia oceani TaxID=2792013 RepID=A0ABS6UK62_9PSEU|nr:site-specific DNA-methyltransferase [Pseudonocardia oceani]MBW0088275.1 site-specific DNA-methyltransferase [Pseudonocardia oceani]MBW0095057.1 site-specific DNA-methyltransferase [Pseudonocardia oceani]MBW0121090.1 site-specific DNA-methyltransferase [Pseudonocardia oceani]MBW0131224.1 site-specific DNA-methyltransferase [Pseudonocardia oceani]MBW0132609.1 site-specific DNA-methyltransferase [Pseudonocardia oceani]